MIPAIPLALAARFARPVSKAALVALGMAGLVAIGGLGVWSAVAGVQSMVADAAATAKAERDAHWRAEIAEANAKAAAAEAAQARAAMAAEASLKTAERGREDALKELEKQNAALADGDRRCLSRSRVRLLNKAR